MLNKSGSSKALQKLFLKHPVVDMNILSDTLQTKSRMSIFRRLKEIGYFSSYTHTGRYYTLTRIPQFDDNGLWFHQEIGFSKSGTLKATIVELVCGSSAGLTHMELNHLLRIKTHNSLLGLVRGGRVGRERIKTTFLYLAPAHSKAAEQTTRRCAANAEAANKGAVVSDTTVIEVLIETIQAGRVRISPSLVAKRFSMRGISIGSKQVEQIFQQYGIVTEKKRL